MRGKGLKMASSSFRASVKNLIGGIMVAGVCFMPVPGWAKDKVELPPGVKVRGTIDGAIGKYTAEKVFYLAKVGLDYKVFRRRIRGLISYIERDLEDIKDKQKDYRREYESSKKELERLKAIHIKHTLRWHELIAAKNFMGEFKMVLRLSGEYKGQIDFETLQRDKTLKKIDGLNEKQIKRQNQLAILKPLSRATEKSKKEERPVIDALYVNVDGAPHFEAHLKLNEDLLKILEKSTAYYKEKAEYYASELKKTSGTFAKVVKRRTKLIAEATTAQLEFVKALGVLESNISTEVWTRWIGQTVADTAEIIIEGKTLPGMLLEAGAKAAEAIIVNGGLMAGKSFSMYDPSKLFGAYQEHGKKLEAHWNDQFGTHKPYTDELMRSMINLGEEILSRGVDAERVRREIRNQMTDMLTNQKASAKAGKGAFESLKKTLHRSQYRLMEAEIAFAQGTVGMAGKNISKSTAMGILDHQRRLAHENVEILARQVAQRRAMAESMEQGAKRTQKILKNFSPREFFKNPGRFISKKAMRKTGVGVARGLAWDALRTGFHAAGDIAAESYWITFLEKEVKVKGYLAVLRQYSLAWLALKSDRVSLTNMRVVYQMFHEESKMILQRYQSKMSGDEGLHVIRAEVIKKDDGKFVVKLKTRGGLYGLKLVLAGARNSVDLQAITKIPTYNTLTDALVQEQIDDINKILTWESKLPDGKLLSSLTKDKGKLTLRIGFL